MLETSAFRACRKDSFFRASRVWATLSVALTALAFSPAAYSEYELYSGEQFNAKVSALLAGYGVTARNARWNFGPTNPTAETDVGPNSNQGEVSFVPQIDLTYDLNFGGTIYSKVSFVAAWAWTFGDDYSPYDYVRDGDNNISREVANLGYRNDWIDVSFGPQQFSVGDALLIGDGVLDCGSGSGCGGVNTGEFFIGSHKAFTETGIVRVNQVPGVEDVRADIFWLKGGSDTFKGGDTQVWGVNVEYVVPEEGLGILSAGTLGLMYVAVTDAGLIDRRDGRRFYDFRLEALTFAALPNTKFYGEVILDDGTNDIDPGQSFDYEGYSWYAEIEHNLQDVPWSPVLGYRYYISSGDDLGSPENEEHDALFYTFKRGWGTWFQGEYAGEWVDNNRNQRSQMVKLVVSPPVPWLNAIHLLGFHHEVDEATTVGGPSGTYADEVNLLVEYWNDSGFYVAGSVAYADIGGAGSVRFLPDNAKDFSAVSVYVQQSF